MSNPAVEAATKAMMEAHNYSIPNRDLIVAARYALKPVREAMAKIKDRYDQVHGWMIAAETSAEQSRHANELAGLMFAYNLICSAGLHKRGDG